MKDRRKVLKMIKTIEQQPGWRVRRGENHTVIYPPDGAPIISLPSTPSEYRWDRNLRASLRQRGWPKDVPL